MAIAPGNHQRLPATFHKGFPLKIRETLVLAQWNQEWCIYGIIYHYAPSFLSNSMVTVSGLHYSISDQVPKPITHFEERLQPLSLTIHGSYQKTIQGPQLPGFPGVGYFIPTVLPQGNTLPGFFKCNFKRFSVIKIRFQGIKHSSTPWTTQLIYTGSIWTACMALAHWANAYYTVGIQDTQLTSHDGQICIDPKQLIQLGNQPSRISLQLFTYTGHLFFPGDVFPS
ncbi:hypothetical protein O181_067766 [Austropuccinia psidii MF-1]|uniref:Uncharacterized protein n=1 Tax=Austropuccinia psidii MF-1 TaxID=1389203 RepID=A0A9Q3F0B0_9BASI|nr:hypothetical protein [Austropuccinia psidii MF-1]